MLRVHKVLKVLQAPLALQELQVEQGLLALKVLKAHKVRQGLKVQQVLKAELGLPER